MSKIPAGFKKIETDFVKWSTPGQTVTGVFEGTRKMVAQDGGEMVVAQFKQPDGRLVRCLAPNVLADLLGNVAVGEEAYVVFVSVESAKDGNRSGLKQFEIYTK